MDNARNNRKSSKYSSESGVISLVMAILFLAIIFVAGFTTMTKIQKDKTAEQQLKSLALNYLYDLKILSLSGGTPEFIDDATVLSSLREAALGIAKNSSEVTRVSTAGFRTAISSSGTQTITIDYFKTVLAGEVEATPAAMIDTKCGEIFNDCANVNSQCDQQILSGAIINKMACAECKYRPEVAPIYKAPGVTEDSPGSSVVALPTFTPEPTPSEPTPTPGPTPDPEDCYSDCQGDCICECACLNPPAGNYTCTKNCNPGGCNPNNGYPCPEGPITN